MKKVKNKLCLILALICFSALALLPMSFNNAVKPSFATDDYDPLQGFELSVDGEIVKDTTEDDTPIDISHEPFFALTLYCTLNEPWEQEYIFNLPNELDFTDDTTFEVLDGANPDYFYFSPDTATGVLLIGHTPALESFPANIIIGINNLEFMVKDYIISNDGQVSLNVGNFELNFCVTGYEIPESLELSNGAAKIGETYYATLAEAFNAVQKDETITLCSDNNEELPILTRTATLDLNGYQIQKKLTTYSSMATLTDSYGGGSVNDGIECEGMLKITNCVVKGEIRNTLGYLWLSDNVEIIGIIYCEDYCNILMYGNITFDTTTYNIFLDTDAKITIIEKLTYTEPIKLLNFGNTGKVICENFDTYMPGCDVEDYFVSSQKSCFLKNDEDGIRVYMREIVSQPTSTNFEIGLNYEKGATYAWNKLFGRPITDADVYMPSSTGTFDSGLWHFGNNNALKLYVEGLSKGDYIVVHVMEDNFIRYGESETNNTFVYYVTANGENYIVLQAAESLAGNSFTATIELFKGADAEVVGTDKKLQAVEFEKLYYCVATYDNGYALTSNAVYSLHQHNFAYSVDGATLTATCANDSCSLTESKISATLVAGDYIYDGNTHGVTIQNVADFEKVTEITLTIYYEGTGSTTYAKTTNAPTNAGNYKASMTLGDLTAEITFEIKATEQNGLTTIQIVLIVLASVLGAGLLGGGIAITVVNSKKKKLK